LPFHCHHTPGAAHSLSLPLLSSTTSCFPSGADSFRFHFQNASSAASLLLRRFFATVAAESLARIQLGFNSHSGRYRAPLKLVARPIFRKSQILCGALARVHPKTPTLHTAHFRFAIDCQLSGDPKPEKKKPKHQTTKYQPIEF